MLESPVISVIIAVYQSEPYLRRCLDSIRAQGFPRFEAILVDDGSYDRSGIICEEYAQSDSRFRVIHAKHGGVGAARQIGLDVAVGDFIIHADPDDWVEPNWLQSLYEKVIEENADMAICDFERVYSDRVVYHSQKPTALDNDSIILDLLLNKLRGFCWNKLIRKSCFDSHGVSFNPTMVLMEDLDVLCSLLAYEMKVCHVPEALYHYVYYGEKSNSLSSSLSDDSVSSYKLFIDTFSPVFSSEKFNSGWYYLKSGLKERIFLTKNCSADIVNTFPEINELYIKESRRTRLWSLKRCVALSLRGHSRFAHLLYRVITRISKLKNQSR